MNKKRLKNFEQYNKAFDKIYLGFRTKRNCWIITATLIAILIAFLIAFMIKDTLEIFKNNLLIIFITFCILFIPLSLVILLFFDIKKLKKDLKNLKNINKQIESKNLKKHEFFKNFNISLELYCKEKLSQEYQIDKEIFKEFLDKLIDRITNLKDEKYTGIAKFIIQLYKFFNSKITILVISLIGLYLPNNYKILILIFLVIMLFITIAYIFLDNRNKNIDIETGRKHVLLDILIEIFIKSTINENIWITEDVEIQLINEGKSFVFVENKDDKDSMVSVIEKDGKFTILKENGEKSIRLKRIEIRDTENINN